MKLFKHTDTLKPIMLAVTILLGFIFIASFSSLYVSEAIRNNNACGCVIPIPYMILLLSSLGLFTGSLAFYILISRYLKARTRLSRNIEGTLKFLENDEKTIFKALVDNKGSLSQSQFEKITGMHKVKVHRLIDKMYLKGIIDKKTTGRMNRIEISSDLKNLFL